MASNRDGLDETRYQQIAWNFYEKQEKFKAVKKKFEQLKEEFEQEMEGYLGSKKSAKFDGLVDDSSVLTIKKSEKTSIEWFPDKLKKRVTKPIARQVIKKRYTIRDMKGLSKYLQSCGVDPDEFRKYLDVEESVDQDAINRLSEVGKITVHNIAGCYMVKCSKPYFTVKVKKDDGYGE